MYSSPARYDTLIMRDTIWANWFGDFEKNTQVSMCISTD